MSTRRTITITDVRSGGLVFRGEIPRPFSCIFLGEPITEAIAEHAGIAPGFMSRSIGLDAVKTETLDRGDRRFRVTTKFSVSALVQREDGSWAESADSERELLAVEEIDYGEQSGYVSEQDICSLLSWIEGDDAEAEEDGRVSMRELLGFVYSPEVDWIGSDTSYADEQLTAASLIRSQTERTHHVESWRTKLGSRIWARLSPDNGTRATG